jgi:hypothetical protein
MKLRRLSVLVALICAVAVMFALGSCGKKSKYKAPEPPKGQELKSFRLNTMNGILATANVSIDSSQSADSITHTKGALKIEAPSSMTVKLVQTGPLSANDCMLIYRATFRSKELSGRAYLLMTVRWSDGLETFSRGFEQAIIGSVPWVMEDISYTLDRTGKTVANVTLGMVIEGTGTVWVNDVKLLKAPKKAF